MQLIPTELMLAGDGQVVQIYRLNGIEPRIMQMATQIFECIAARNEEAFEGTARMTQLRVLCNGNETLCESPRDLSELFGLLEIPTEQAVQAMKQFFASGYQNLIINSSTFVQISDAA